MTHDEFIRAAVEVCQNRGLLVHACLDSRHCTGTRGLPDLIIASVKGILCVEVKTSTFNGVGPGQITWIYTLRAAGVIAEILTVDQWDWLLTLLNDLAA